LSGKWIIVLMAGVLSTCSALPSLKARSISAAFLADEGADTRLGQGLKPVVEQHPGLSGVTEEHPWHTQVLGHEACTLTLGCLRADG
jgi:hypothetical protein